MKKKPNQPKHNVVVLKRAWQMLGAHMRFLAKVSPEAAQKTRETLVEAIRSLDVMPERYPFFEGELVPRDKYRRMGVSRRYLILYHIRGDTVFVEYIFDCREDFGWLID